MSSPRIAARARRAGPAARAPPRRQSSTPAGGPGSRSNTIDVGCIGVVDGRLLRVQLERGEVGHPHQGRPVVDHARHEARLDLAGRDPFRRVRWAPLLEERRAVDAVGPAHHREGPPPQVGQHHRRDPDVVVDDRGFREATSGYSTFSRLVSASWRPSILDLDACLTHRPEVDLRCPCSARAADRRSVRLMAGGSRVPSAIWTGTISFGLVTRARASRLGDHESRDVRFNQLEEATGARIRYRKVSEQTGDEVAERADRQGLRDLARASTSPSTDDEMQRARAQGEPHDRHRGLRRPRPHRPDLLRAAVLPGARPELGSSRTGCSSTR